MSTGVPPELICFKWSKKEEKPMDELDLGSGGDDGESTIVCNILDDRGCGVGTGPVRRRYHRTGETFSCGGTTLRFSGIQTTARALGLEVFAEYWIRCEEGEEATQVELR